MSCCFLSDPDTKRALQRDKEITSLVKADFKQKQKVIQMLLLGTGESGKSTVRKQMQIIHINGFSVQERLEKIAYMRRNIRDSIACIVAAMDKLAISYGSDLAAQQGNWLLMKMLENQPFNSSAADHDPFDYSDEFFQVVESLWKDAGVQESYRNSNRYQLIDCAKYFLDRVHLFRNKNYLPSDQDILRCRIMTNDISDIEFDIKDGRHNVKFRVFDVGGQKGERKKWIQCFNNVTAILYLCDVSSFDLTLKEDVGRERPKNRLLESLNTFQEVWLNRYLQDVSILLFINKIDQLEEKIQAGKSLQSMIASCQRDVQRKRRKLEAKNSGKELHRSASANQGATANQSTLAAPANQSESTALGRSGSISPSRSESSKKKSFGPVDLRAFIAQFSYDEFRPSDDDKKEFLLSFPRLEDSDIGHSRSTLDGEDSMGRGRRHRCHNLAGVHEETVKTACYVKQIFMEIAKRKRRSEFKYEYHHHTCCFYYTCAVNTDNVKKVLEGCRAFIIDQHLERFGIL